jgi:hypothetical protein
MFDSYMHYNKRLALRQRVSNVFPSLIQSPAVSGLLNQNSDLTFDVGLWRDAYDFDIELVQINPSRTILYRQNINNDTSGNIDTDIGSSLILKVWAKNGSSQTYAESLPFGPIIEPGDQWIGGFSISPDNNHNPTPVNSPVTWTSLRPTTLYSSETGYGFNTNAGTFSSVTGEDPRIAARWNSNSAPTSKGFRLDTPGSGVYEIYASLGLNTTSTTLNMAIWDGPSSVGTTLLHEINPSGNIVASGRVHRVDALGNVLLNNEWLDASIYGGYPVQVTTTGNSLYFARCTGNTGAMNVNCWAVLKKA